MKIDTERIGDARVLPGQSETKTKNLRGVSSMASSLVTDFEVRHKSHWSRNRVCCSDDRMSSQQHFLIIRDFLTARVVTGEWFRPEDIDSCLCGNEWELKG